VYPLCTSRILCTCIKLINACTFVFFFCTACRNRVEYHGCTRAKLLIVLLIVRNTRGRSWALSSRRGLTAWTPSRELSHDSLGVAFNSSLFRVVSFLPRDVAHFDWETRVRRSSGSTENANINIPHRILMTGLVHPLRLWLSSELVSDFTHHGRSLGGTALHQSSETGLPF